MSFITKLTSKSVINCLLLSMTGHLDTSLMLVCLCAVHCLLVLALELVLAVGS